MSATATAKTQLIVDVVATGRENLVKFQRDLRENIRLGQTSSLVFRSQHQSLILLGQTLSRVGSIAHGFIGLYNAIAINQLNARDATRGLTDAQDTQAEAWQRVQELTQQYSEALAKYGSETAPPVLEIQGQLQAANDAYAESTRRVRGAQDELNNQLPLQIAFWSSIALMISFTAGQIIGILPKLAALNTTLIAHGVTLTAFTGALKGAALAMIGTGGLVAAIAIVAAGMAAGVGNILANKTATNSWSEAIELAIANTKNWPPVLRELGEFFTKSAGGWILLGEQIAIGASNMSRDISNWAAGAGATITGFVGGAQTAFNNFVTFITGIAESIWQPLANAAVATWDAIGKAIKSGINFIIDNINKLIAGWNFIITSVNRVSSVIGVTLPTIPSIPRLAKGGTIAQAGFATVGESGPEILSLPKGAQVRPLTGGGGGFGDLHVHVHVNGIISDNVAHEIGKIAGEQIFRQVRRLGSKVVQ